MTLLSPYIYLFQVRFFYQSFFFFVLTDTWPAENHRKSEGPFIPSNRKPKAS